MDTPPLIPGSQRPRPSRDEDDNNPTDDDTDISDSTTSSWSELPSPDRGSSEDELEEHGYSEDEFLGILALARQARELYELSSQLTDLEDCIAYLRDALSVGPRDPAARANTLHTLAYDLYIFGLHAGASDEAFEEDFFSEAISLHRQALRLLSARSSERPLYTTRLAIALRARFSRSAQKADLQECISLHRKALSYRPPGHPDRSQSLLNLANAYWTRFELSGNAGDLERATQLDEEALALRPHGHPNRTAALTGLATDLSTRYLQSNQPQDLDRAIELEREASHLSPTDDHIAQTLASLLVIKYHATRDPAEFDAVSSVCTRSMQGGTHGNNVGATAAFLQILAEAYVARFEYSGEPQCLAEAWKLCRRCLKAGHCDTACFTVARVFLSRYHGERRRPDLDDAVNLCQDALNHCPPGHPHRATCLYTLAQAFEAAFEVERQETDLDGALGFYAEAAQDEHSSVRDRFQYIEGWLALAEKAGRTHSLFVGCTIAVHLFARIVYFDEHVDVRMGAMERFPKLLQAVASTIPFIPAGAFEVLDYARTVSAVLSTSLHSPSSLTGILPAINQRLCQISWQLEHSLSSVPFSPGRGPPSSPDIRDTGRDDIAYRRRLVREFNALVGEVSASRGHAGFLRPSPYASLSNGWGEDGFAAMLIATQRECYAFVVFPTSIKPLTIPLPLSPADLKSIADGFVVAARNGDEQLYRTLLEGVWQGVVGPIIQKLMLKPESGHARPRVWWCPIGWFSLIPVHAAGRYASDASPACACDYMVSSYTPTIRFLSERARVVTTDVGDGKVLQIVQLSLPETARLTGTVSIPVYAVPKMVPPGALLYSGSLHYMEDDNTSSADVVLEPLAFQRSLLHLPHGTTRNTNTARGAPSPSGSRTTTYSTLYDSVVGNPDHPREFTSLGSVMLTAGFCSGVASMWKSSGTYDSILLEAFERELFQRGSPTRARVPYVLDNVVQQLRKSGASFKDWTRLVHIGL